MPAALGVYKSRKLSYPAATVYETWIDPRVRVPPITDMQADVREGGEVRIVIETSGIRSIMSGTYRQVQPGQRLQYTWQWSHSEQETLVNVEFRETPTGSRLILTHEGFTKPADREAHSLTWDAYLQQLERELSVRAEAECNQL